MTTEEKAKAYDEAKDKMHEIIVMNDNPVRPTEIAKYVFPELAESEDERIRKAIIHHILYETKLDEATGHSWIAYLEKQNDVPSRKTSLGIWKLGNFWKENQVERDGLTQLQYIQKYLCLGLKNATIDYLKEQKPAEKQDYSDLTDFERAIHRGFLCAGVENVPVEIIKETAQDCLAHIEQNPAEWSEEDEKMVGRLCSVIRECASYNCALDVNGDYCEGDYAKLDDWLKSLRPQPHWKPSEEQMEAMLWEINSTSEGSWQRREMEALYNELKKL